MTNLDGWKDIYILIFNLKHPFEELEKDKPTDLTNKEQKRGWKVTKTRINQENNESYG